MKTSLSILFIFTALSVLAQKERTYINEGNEYFRKNDYTNSVVSYEKALQGNPKSFEANYNMGNALYKQANPQMQGENDGLQKALDKYKVLAATEKDPNNLAQIYHNMGNTYIKMGKLNEAISAYKNALRNNPNDEESRYNLIASQQAKKQQEQQQNQDKNQEQNEEKKEEQNKNEQKQNQDKNEDSKENEKNEQNQNQQPQKGQQISKEDAERILKNLENDEKMLIDKMKKQNFKSVKVDKDW